MTRSDPSGTPSGGMRGNMADLFSEVYGCYYVAINEIMHGAYDGITETDMEAIIREHAFHDSAFYIMPRLMSGEWDLLKKDGSLYYSKLENKATTRPITVLEQSWIKALLLDRRTKLFLSDNEIALLIHHLADTEPLFKPEDYHVFDVSLDGDDYDNEEYRKIFKVILSAIENKQTLNIHYRNNKTKISHLNMIPFKLCYSSRDDKFRLLALQCINEHRYEKKTFNLSRIQTVEVSPLAIYIPENMEEIFEQSERKVSVKIKIFQERNALERCMLQFSSWYKKTEYDEEQDCYLCEIFYDRSDETELLIRLLSFGPAIQVLSPESFVKQIRERIRRQIEFNLS